MGIKMSIGGKYAGTKREFSPNTAGNKTTGLGGGTTVHLGFIGSGVNSYPFTRVIGGIRQTITVRAHSVKEANRIAATRGFKTTDREVKRRNNNKKKRKK